MLRSKIQEIIKEFIDDSVAYKSIDGIFNYFVKHNFISIDIHDIFHGKNNRKKFFLSAFNCMVLWSTLFVNILLLISNTLLSLLEDSILPFDKIKLILSTSCFVTIQIAIFKTDVLREEKRNNLIEIKFLYYIMINHQINHKLNKYNYKIYTFFVGILYLSIQLSYISLFISLFMVFIVIITSKSVLIITSSPLIIYAIYVIFTSLCSLLAMIYMVLIYYIMRFNQINIQLRIFHKIIRISPRKIVQIINEHNQLSLAIDKLNLIMNKIVGYIFIITAIQIDLIIYLLFYTKSLYYKLLFLSLLIVTLIAIFSITFLLIKLPNSAHKSYNLIYSIISRRILPYRIRYKVNKF